MRSFFQLNRVIIDGQKRGLKKMQQQQLAEIYDRHVETVYRVCSIYLKNKADTEDAVSDTFVRLIRSGTVFENAEHEKAWLIVTAKNICRDRLKSPRYRFEPLSDDMLTGNIEVDETLMLLRSLPEKYRTVIYLHYYEGYTCEEIAKMLKIAKSTAGSRLDRGRKKLKEILEE